MGFILRQNSKQLQLMNRLSVSPEQVDPKEEDSSVHSLIVVVGTGSREAVGGRGQGERTDSGVAIILELTEVFSILL
ncbi:hypothetical protein Cadr_000010295 [Camelus dromedarius]|uniref:Uncharacterized protein n=1 Tax=Camelus dromedarius TaxID=9838 RepID=A0A5N4DVC2_CAMDR|nr:hypothetical protein Cadr_000010295 [Camelus dromedarius]